MRTPPAVIIYDLSCEQQHRFEGWFRSAENFSRQRDGRLLACPVCGSERIEKIPSGGHILHRADPTAGTPTVMPDAPAGATPTTTTPPKKISPEQLLRQVVQALVQTSEDVGQDFASEARKIHQGDAPARAIRGQASDEEYEALEDEGIDVLRLPTLDDEPTH